MALTIAGADPTGGAGVQADLKVFHRLGLYGFFVLSALTAQNTFRVSESRPVDSDFIEEQLDTLLSDIRPQALKTGMLYSPEAVRVVAKTVKGFDLRSSYSTVATTSDFDRARASLALLEQAGARVTYCEEEVGHKLGANCLRALETYLQNPLESINSLMQYSKTGRFA